MKAICSVVQIAKGKKTWKNRCQPILLLELLDIELSVSKGKIHTHQVEEDGSLSSLDDLFDDNERTIG